MRGQRLFFVLWLPPMAVLASAWLLRFEWVPSWVRGGLGGCVFTLVVWLFFIPSTMLDKDLFERGIGVGPAGAAGWLATVIFWTVAAALGAVLTWLIARPVGPLGKGGRSEG